MNETELQAAQHQLIADHRQSEILDMLERELSKASEQELKAWSETSAVAQMIQRANAARPPHLGPLQGTAEQNAHYGLRDSLRRLRSGGIRQEQEAELSSWPTQLRSRAYQEILERPTLTGAQKEALLSSLEHDGDFRRQVVALLIDSIRSYA